MKNNIKKYVFFSLFTQACLLTISGQEIKNISNNFDFNNKDNENIKYNIENDLVSSKLIDEHNPILNNLIVNLKNIELNKYLLNVKQNKDLAINTSEIIPTNYNLFYQEILLSLFISFITFILFKLQSNQFIQSKNIKIKKENIETKHKVIIKISNNFIITLKNITKLYHNLFFYKHTNLNKISESI